MIKWFGLAGKITGCIFLLCACQNIYAYRSLKTELSAPVEGAFYVGTDHCISCHDDIYSQFKKTVHARLSSHETSDSVRGCESCHGPGSKHVKSGGGTDNIFSFPSHSENIRSEVCLSCHDSYSQENLRNTTHSLNGIACNDCHKAHNISTDKMLFFGDPGTCYTCHLEKKTRNALPSHHPVREKKMKCCDCHNPHGVDPDNLKVALVNDLCFECHAEYQGPFVYEHEPAFENCSICHNPHGTIADNLLRQSEPFICLRCHRGHRKNPGTGSHPTVSSFISSCTQCHSQVHGTDLPSQVNKTGLTR